MNHNDNLIQLYDLSNFQCIEITVANKILTGQFVQFAVAKNTVETYYPRYQYCFLPSVNRKEYRELYDSMGGILTEIPSYIELINPKDVSMIVIRPV